ncbi:MAG: hypothetical protein ABWZ76_08370 [Acidimicrobiales bacterium]
MRVVLCDDDELLLEVVETVVARLGHEIIGITDSTAGAVQLIKVGRPDVVIYDLTLGYGSDFDVVAAAIESGVTPILFTHEIDEPALVGYEPRPAVVPKPDIVGLQSVLERMELDPERDVVIDFDRRVRPSRSPVGSAPIDVRDAQAFYEALQDLSEDDALISVDVSGAGDLLATGVLSHHRQTDRVLASDAAVRVFLPGAGQTGIDSLRRRLARSGTLPLETLVRSIVVRDGEDPGAAFDRLKSAEGRLLADDAASAGASLGDGEESV